MGGFGLGDGKMLPRYRAVGWVSPNSFGMCNDFVAIEAAQLGLQRGVVGPGGVWGSKVEGTEHHANLRPSKYKASLS